MTEYSRSVDWYTVHEFVESTLNEVGSWPMVGTLPWRYLPNDDPRKLAAIFDAARHWALRVDIAQQAMDEAGQAISAAEKWSEVAQQVQRRHEIDAHRKAG